MRTDIEGRGPREKGRPGKRARAPAPLRPGPGRSRLPPPLRSAPPLGPAPTPARNPPLRRVRGNTLLGDFLVPERASVLAAYAFPEPWCPPASSPFNLAGLPTSYAPGHRRDEDTHQASAVPSLGPSSLGTLTQSAMHPRGLHGQAISAQRGRQSRGDQEPGGTSMKVEAPQSTYTPWGS